MVLKDLGKGKAITGSVSPRACHKEKNVAPKKKTPIPSHLEISFQTQQMLERNIRQDCKEKVQLASEIIYVANIPRFVCTMVKEDKRSSWKLLRKFFARR